MQSNDSWDIINHILNWSSESNFRGRGVNFIQKEEVIIVLKNYKIRRLAFKFFVEPAQKSYFIYFLRKMFE
jgi:hypothetical protein